MTRATGKRLLAAAVVGGAAVVAAACHDTRSSVLDPQAVQYGFALNADGRNLPTGSAGYRRPGTGGAGTVDSAIVVSVRGLDSLVGKVYQVWLADTLADASDLTNVVKATGTLRIVRTDSTVDQNGDVVTSQNVRTLTGVSSFSNGGPATSLELTVTRPSLGGTLAPYAKQIVLISIEDNASAAKPGALRPLWARRIERPTTTDAAGVTTLNETATIREGSSPPDTLALTSVAPLRFGTFSVKRSAEYQYKPVGRGRGEIGADFVVFDDSSLMRPPVGYYYAGYLIKLDDKNKPVDTLDLGAQTAPYPRRNVSLREADVSVPDPVVQTTPPSIQAAANRVSVDTVARFKGMTKPFSGFAFGYVTLESKYGREGVAAPTIVLAGTVPGVVRAGTK